MYKSPVFKSAAYIALINAVLFIPLLILAIVAGFLDGISNTFIFQASYNFILILFELPSIFVLWVLGKVVQPKGIIWPIRVLIGLSVLGVFHAIGEYLMPVEWTDAWLRLLWTIAITTVLANFSLALRIINKRSGSWEVNLFYPFALLTLIGSLLTATVILLPLALLCWLAASFLLAAAFFKLTKGQAPDKPVLHQEVSISIPYLMFASSALALLSAFLLLGITYGLCGISSAIGEQHIESLLLTALIVQAALTAYVFPRRFATPSLRLTLLLSLVVALFLAISYENPSLLQSQSNDPGIFNNLATLVTSTVTRYVLSVLFWVLVYHSVLSPFSIRKMIFLATDRH